MMRRYKVSRVFNNAAECVAGWQYVASDVTDDVWEAWHLCQGPAVDVTLFHKIYMSVRHQWPCDAGRIELFVTSSNTHYRLPSPLRARWYCRDQQFWLIKLYDL